MPTKANLNSLIQELQKTSQVNKNFFHPEHGDLKAMFATQTIAKIYHANKTQEHYSNLTQLLERKLIEIDVALQAESLPHEHCVLLANNKKLIQNFLNPDPANWPSDFELLDWAYGYSTIAAKRKDPKGYDGNNTPYDICNNITKTILFPLLDRADLSEEAQSLTDYYKLICIISFWEDNNDDLSRDINLINNTSLLTTLRLRYEYNQDLLNENSDNYKALEKCLELPQGHLFKRLARAILEYAAADDLKINRFYQQQQNQNQQLLDNPQLQRLASFFKLDQCSTLLELTKSSPAIRPQEKGKNDLWKTLQTFQAGKVSAKQLYDQIKSTNQNLKKAKPVRPWKDILSFSEGLRAFINRTTQWLRGRGSLYANFRKEMREYQTAKKDRALLKEVKFELMKSFSQQKQQTVNTTTPLTTTQHECSSYKQWLDAQTKTIDQWLDKTVQTLKDKTSKTDIDEKVERQTIKKQKKIKELRAYINSSSYFNTVPQDTATAAKIQGKLAACEIFASELGKNISGLGM